MPSKDDVMQVLSKIDDPELKRPLTDLGMVGNIDINGDKVTVGITLTVPGCPLKEKIAHDVRTGVEALEGVKTVAVEFDVMNDQQREELKRKMGHGAHPQAEEDKPLTFAKRFIAVASGKGGVGKSTVTANLAAALHRMGHKVGVLDADVYGFSIPRMLGVTDQPTAIDEKLVPPRFDQKMQVVSMGLFVGEDEPVVWRGPMLHKMINQFLADVMWDDLDYLLMDLPPGTGDVTITIAQALPNAEVLVVTTPQVTATHVAGRVAALANKTNLSVAGVVENMAWYMAGEKKEYIFGQGGGKDLANQLNVPLVGEIPLLISVREGADTGKPVAIYGSEEEIKLFEGIACRLDAIKQC
mgnify:CR=1 FL=1